MGASAYDRPISSTQDQARNTLILWHKRELNKVRKTSNLTWLHTPQLSQTMHMCSLNVHKYTSDCMYCTVCVCTHILAFFRGMPLKHVSTQVINQDGVRERGRKREFSYELLSLYSRRGDNPPSSWFLAGLHVRCPMKKLQQIPGFIS